MSAPALHPTACIRPVLMERLKRRSWGYLWAALVMVGMIVHLRVTAVEVTYSAAVAAVMLVGSLLASAAHERRPIWDATLPMDPARYALVRLLCGVAGAASLLLVLVGLYAALFGDPGHPGWYPLALIAWGLTAHLLASALFLTAGIPIGLLVLLVVCAIAAVLLPASLEQPEELGRMAVAAVLARTALLLGLAAALAYAVACFTRRAPEQSARTPRWNPAAARASRAAPLPPRLAPPPVRPAPLPYRPAGPPVRRARLAPPSAALIVFRRHFALLLRFAMLAAPFLGVLILFTLYEPILDVNQGGKGPTVRWFVSATQLGDWCAGIAIAWSVLVWVAEYGARRRWNDTLPVGTAKRRILHATAGAAWLLLFLTVVVAATLGRLVEAGMLASAAESPAWLWLWLPVRTLTLYLATTLVFFGPRLALKVSPIVVYVLTALRVDRVAPLMIVMMTIGIVGVPYGSLVLGIDLLESQAGVVAGHAGSEAVSMLWLVLYAAAAAMAVVLEDWIHRLGRLPTVPELRSVLHGWAGTRPAAPLQGHAGQ